MSENSQEKLWYQNGWLVLGGAIFFAYLAWALIAKRQYDQLSTPVPQFAARLDTSQASGPMLDLIVWHQTPGNLENGMLAVSVNDPQMESTDESLKLHSFEVWAPNRDHAVSFRFPLTNYAPQKEYRVSLMLAAKNAKGPEWRHNTWVGNDWKSESDASASGSP